MTMVDSRIDYVYDPDNPPYGSPYCVILEVVRYRENAQGLDMMTMIDVRDWYNGDIVAPLVGAKGEPSYKSMAPAIVANAVDYNARRASSVKPYITVPSVGAGPRSVDYSDVTRKALGATWYKSNFGLIRRRYYRHLVGYGSGSLVVVPDFEAQGPRVQLRDPLATLPDFKSPDDVRPPRDIAYVFRWSGADLRRRYPKLREEQGGPIAASDPEQQWRTVEWWDAEATVYGLVGPTELEGAHIANGWESSPYMEIGRFPNRAGMVPAVVMEMLTMDKVISQVRNIIAKSEMLAKLTMLDIETQERSIAPDMYMVARQGMIPTLVGAAQWYDGRTGKVNMISGVEKVDTLRTTPDVRTAVVEDRLERSASVDVGLNPAANAETYGSLRTGRGLDSMMAIASDPRILELHEISEAHLVTLNEAIVKTYKGFWPNKKFSMFSGWVGDRSMVDFTPAKHFTTTESMVNYPVPGADIQGTTVILGQLAASKAIPLDEFRRLHPYISDAQAMRRGIDQEDLVEAYKRGLAVMMASGQAPPELGIYINNCLAQGEDFFTAVQKGFEKMQQLEEAKAADQSQPTTPGLPMPGAPPGMPAAGPGQLALPPGETQAGGPGNPPGVQPAPATVGPNPDQQGLKNVMGALMAGQRR
jgi:hypothetical protein